MIDYFVVWKGNRSGPYSQEQILKMLETGEISTMHAVYQGTDLIDVQALVDTLSQRQSEMAAHAAHAEAAVVAEAAAAREAEKIAQKEELGLYNSRQVEIESYLKTQGLPGAGERRVDLARKGKSLGQFSKAEIQAGLNSGQFHETDTLYDLDANAWIPINNTADFVLMPNCRSKKTKTQIMNDKKDFVDSMRADTAYPIFRQVVYCITILAYAAAVVAALTGVVCWIKGLAKENDSAAWMWLFLGFAYGIGIFVMTVLYQGFLTMMADIADSNIDKVRKENDNS